MASRQEFVEGAIPFVEKTVRPIGERAGFFNFGRKQLRQSSRRLVRKEVDNRLIGLERAFSHGKPQAIEDMIAMRFDKYLHP